MARVAIGPGLRDDTRMPTTARLSAVLLIAAGALLAACPATRPAVQSISGPDAALAPIAVSPEPSPSTSGASIGAPSGSFGNGGLVMPAISTAVKSPVFSEDSCVKDTDCEPVAECHAARCVAAANAGMMTKGTLCTMDCRGGTIDCSFNHCGCADAPGLGKRCALLAGGKP